MTQTQTVALRGLLRAGWVSPIDALQKLGCFRLAARVRDLRDQGELVLDRWQVLPSGKRIKCYRLPE